MENIYFYNIGMVLNHIVYLKLIIINTPNIIDYSNKYKLYNNNRHTL